MAECTHVPPEEIERRETYLRAYNRPRQWYDVYSWSYPFKCAAFSAGSSVSLISFYNMLNKFPWYYALYPRAAGVALVTVCGYGMGKLRGHHYSTRDAVVEHYMELHPNDFERVTDIYGRPYASILMPWIPCRTEYRTFDDK